MARSKKTTNSTKKTTTSKKKLLASVILLVLLLVGDFVYSKVPQTNEMDSEQRVSIVETLIQNFLNGQDIVSDTETDDSVKSESFEASEYTSSKLEIYFFDVGQADSIALFTDGKVMLVDTGNAGDAQNNDKLVKGNINLTHELKRLGVTRIDKLVLTHPHEDHMGSAYKIINTFDVDDLYVNALLDEEEQANYYERFVEALNASSVHMISPTTLSEKEIIAKIEAYNDALREKDLSAEDLVEEELVYNAEDYIRLGDEIKFGNAVLTMIAPASAEYSDTNDYSIVWMLEFEGVKVLLTGDAGKESEEEMLKFASENNFDLDCDVLKVGHHGSRTASTEAFISAVSPEYAVVMVSEGNSYGLPDEDVIERLENHNAVVYQTKDKGDIKLIIDDGEYKFDFSYSHEEKPEE